MRTLLTAAFCLLATAAASAQELRMEKVADGIHVLFGRGGNIGVVTGGDAPFLIDDQMAPATEGIVKEVGKLDERAIRFVINTHWHGDHTGGNENLGRAGAILVAHENVRKRLSAGLLENYFGRKVEPAPAEALPVITFTRDVSFHLNGHTIQARHLEFAHTDGDAIIVFPEADVIHMGDIFFNGSYPFIDLTVGGSVRGVIAAAGVVLETASAKTAIVPGHGPLGNRDDLLAYRKMLTVVADRVEKLIGEGKSLEQVQSAAPTADFDEKWGGGFMNPERFVELVYRDLAD